MAYSFKFGNKMNKNEDPLFKYAPSVEEKSGFDYQFLVVVELVILVVAITVTIVVVGLKIWFS